MSGPPLATGVQPCALAISAIRWAVVVATDELLAALVSSRGLVAVTVAVLAIEIGRASCRDRVIVKVWVALAARVPTLQVKVPAVVVQPGLAETKLTWAGSTSVTVPPLEVEGPLLLSVRE